LTYVDVKEHVVAGRGIYVVWFLGRQVERDGRWYCELQETLCGVSPGSRFELPCIGDFRPLVGSSRAIARPYSPRLITTSSLHLVVGDIRNGVMSPILRVPLIGTDDECVRTVRRWVEAARQETESRSSRPAVK
jgi:hypothetical protein